MTENHYRGRNLYRLKKVANGEQGADYFVNTEQMEDFLEHATPKEILMQRKIDLENFHFLYKDKKSKEEVTLPIYTKDENGNFMKAEVNVLSEHAQKVKAIKYAIKSSRYLKRAWDESNYESYWAGRVHRVVTDPTGIELKIFERNLEAGMGNRIETPYRQTAYYKDENGQFQELGTMKQVSSLIQQTQGDPAKAEQKAKKLSGIAKNNAQNKLRNKKIQRIEETQKKISRGYLTVAEGRKIPLSEFYQHWESNKGKVVGVETPVEVPKKGWRGLLLGETETVMQTTEQEPAPGALALRKVRESFSPEVEERFRLYMEAKSVNASPSVLAKIEESYAEAMSRQRQNEVDAVVNRQKTKDQLFLERLHAADKGKDSYLQL